MFFLYCFHQDDLRDELEDKKFLFKDEELTEKEKEEYRWGTEWEKCAFTNHIHSLL